MKIPLYRPTICRAEMEAVLKRMVEGQVGPDGVYAGLSAALSANFAQSCALVLRSPAIAFDYAIKAMDLPPNSSVILSPLSPCWVYRRLEEHSIKPVFVDTIKNGIFMDVEKIKERVGGASAIIVDEPLGFMPDMQELLALGVPIIEDISKSIGAERGGIAAGVSGNVVILGLEGSDLLTAGGGAALIANDKNCQTSLKILEKKAFSVDIMPDINASLALIQLKQNKKNIEAKKELLEKYKAALLHTKHKTIYVDENDVNPIYCFPIIFESGVAEIEKFMEKKDIEIMPAFKDSALALEPSLQETYVNATSMLFRTFLFPLYPLLGLKKAMEIAKIISVLP